MYIFARRNNLNILLILDAAAPGVALAQAIGRWGNFVNQELYGPPTDLPWKIFIRPENRISPYQDHEYFHPLFLYESLWSLGNMFFLLWIARRFSDRLKTGDVFLVYLITYPVIRILLDFIRVDASEIAGINANQTFMVIVLLAAVGVLVYRHKVQDKPT